LIYSGASFHLGSKFVQTYEDFKLRVEWLILFEVCMFTVVVVSVGMVSWSTQDEIRKEALMLTMQNEGSATADMLEMFCDTVVELDADLRIASDAPKFAALLMLGPNRDTIGLQVQEFMPLEEDQQRLETALRGASSHLINDLEALQRLPQLGAFHAEMRDSDHGKLSVEFSFVCFEGLDGETRFLLGIRETADQGIADLKAFGKPARRRRTQRGRGRTIAPLQLAPSAIGRSGDSAGSEASQHAEGEHSSVSSGSGSPCLLAPHLQPTHENARILTLVANMQSWNVAVKAGQCCSFHGAVQSLQAVVDKLADWNCQSDLKLSGDAQCQRCGTMYTWQAQHDHVSAQACGVCQRDTVIRIPCRASL